MSKESKVIVLTGVTYGLGEAMLNCFIKNGHTVVGCGRSQEKIENLSKDFPASKCNLSLVDVVNSESVEQWAKKTISECGTPDIIINNAGIINDPVNVWELPLEKFNNVIDVNIKGVNNVVHFFLPSMVKANKGVIVNMSSGWGRSVSPKVTAYCCSKWGIEGYSLALARELPSPLSCVSLNPGTINTQMLNTVFDQDYCEASYTPEKWATIACPRILSIDRSSNGKQLTI